MNLTTMHRSERGAENHPATVPVQRKRASRQRLFGSWWWALPALLLTALVHYIAVGIGGSFAFTNWRGLGAFQWIGVDNFARILANPQSRGALVNTLFLAVGYLLGTCVLGLALALALNRGVKTRYFLRSLIFMPTVLSPLAVSYIWRFIYQQEGPLNGLLAGLGLSEWQRTWLADPGAAIWAILIVMVWQSTGLVMVIFLAGLAGIPQELEEAAAIDGASTLSRFRHIVFPSCAPRW
ncbi:carbohydrate ABC transporter permease [Arthrobacter sp. SD76]|uniref:carbohydrate ABC transporter permease n=1 Tax=Arthrobacter sp. SD76 TaxID=3415007 RepID=UPI003C73F6B7